MSETWRPMTDAERSHWRVRDDQCATLTTDRLLLDSACLLPLPCPNHAPRMTADHPTREERYAAVQHTMAVEDNPGHADWTDCATTGPCRDEGRRFAALVAADPAPAQPACTCGPEAFLANQCWHFPDCPRAVFDRPAQPDAALSDEEARAEPIHTDDCESWACNHCQVCGVGVLYGSRCHAHPTPGSSGDGALAARADLPVPAPDMSRGVAEALRELERVYSLANEATLNPLTDEARGFRRGVLDALGDAMGIVRDALPADDGADCCRERTTAGGCGCES